MTGVSDEEILNSPDSNESFPTFVFEKTDTVSEKTKPAEEFKSKLVNQLKLSKKSKADLLPGWGKFEKDIDDAINAAAAIISDNGLFGFVLESNNYIKRYNLSCRE